MPYLVRTMPRAERDLKAIFRYIRAAHSPPANEWFGGLLQSMEALAEHPTRHPQTHEDANLRQLLYGDKPHIYRVIYQVDQPGRLVNILHIRHHSRQAFSSEAVTHAE